MFHVVMIILFSFLATCHFADQPITAYFEEVKKLARAIRRIILWFHLIRD